LIPLPDRALFWPSQNALVIADTHFGKSAHFRHMGLPVPAGTTAKDLARITALTDTTGATTLIILGDLFHAKEAHEDAIAAIAAYQSSHPRLTWKLVPGNHDRHAQLTHPNLKLELLPPGTSLDGFTLTHEPPFESEISNPKSEISIPQSQIANRAEGLPSAKSQILCGHLHPAISLRDFDRSTLSLPAFALISTTEATTLILPAFGSFTGSHSLTPTLTCRLFACHKSTITEIAHKEPRTK
jgi:metallophosphoesterase superfamily enzyme